MNSITQNGFYARNWLKPRCGLSLEFCLRQNSGGNPHNNGGNPHNSGGNPHDNGGNPHDNGGNPHNNGGNPHDNGGNPHNSGGNRPLFSAVPVDIPLDSLCASMIG
ncbi:MAG: hypothetical protein LBL31_08210 [Spirochaetaceae bacterium]|nr:hypothetical protein [Spirochaetaceae bacterium]